ncbi:MAG: hypothetical protein IKZ58_01795 [Selenomonadaceae bacterium]|nr:hypothetical protein [Selenomonadaceae bacterium]
MGLTSSDKEKAISIRDIKIEGVEFQQLMQLEINHAVNEYANARLTLIMEDKEGENFLKQADADKIKISAKVDNKDTVLFQGYVSNVSFQPTVDYNLLTIDLYDASYLLNWKRATQSFQKLEDKYEDILKKTVTEEGATVQLKVTDKAIEKMIIRLNETSWQFIKRMASQFNASIFTDITAEKPMVTIGLPDSKKTVEITAKQVSYNFDDATFQFFNANETLKAKDTKIINEDFASVSVDGLYEYLNIADTVKLNEKEYIVKSLNMRFVDTVLVASYNLVGKTAFFVPIETQQNIYGRVFRAQVKKVEKDKVQAHLIDVDEKYEEGTTWFPFATAYSSADGSGWYVMPEVDDYVRILFPSVDTSDAFALSSINTAPLKEPKNKSLKAPGGREILLTDKGVEIIAEHQKTFILLDKDKGINIVSAKDIVINADGNVSFDAKGKIQMVSQKEIAAQSGQSHMKILSNQIDMGGSNIIVGE